MRPYFSIIIPTRKITIKIIKEALPALERQSFKYFECLIVVDENSEMEKKLLEKYKFLKILKNPNNTKPGLKRDIGAQKAKGEILSFIDDDVYPPKNWLKNAKKIFNSDQKIHLLGGPGTLPPKVNFWETVFDVVLTSPLGSGTYTHRFQPEKSRFLDDYPSMNLMIKKSVFVNNNGFGSTYWPGEDSKMINKLIANENSLVLYDPSVYVFHHRRNSLKAYLNQHKNYGSTRGLFLSQGDKNSVKLTFLIPSLFFLYLILLPIFYLDGNNLLIKIYLIPIFFYLTLLLYLFFHGIKLKRGVKVSVVAMIVLPLTHLVYGVYFLLAILNHRLNCFRH
jgi:glycosyltransferase involved in cell wall biosynthesis